MDDKKQKIILLVEDEGILAMQEIMELERYGYFVYHVTTGEKAVDSIFDNSLPVDLILMDIDLGSGIDGTKAAEKILKIKDIPVVFLSSHTEIEMVEKTEKITSYGYVVKNTGIVVLDASIKMAFKLFHTNLKTRLVNEKLESSVQNLREHQIELQMQHEELNMQHAELEALKSKYSDLYELAPAGYFSLSENGDIVEANLTGADLLGITRNALHKQRFFSFIISDDQDIYYMHCKKLFESGMPQACELRIRNNHGSVFPVFMRAVPSDDINGARGCHVIIIEQDTVNEKKARV